MFRYFLSPKYPDIFNLFSFLTREELCSRIMFYFVITIIVTVIIVVVVVYSGLKIRLIGPAHPS